MAKVKITPRGKQILVQPDPEGNRESKTGIITPRTVDEEKKAIGTVLAVGPEIPDVSKGQRVIYGVFSGEKITFRENGKEVEYALLHDDDVLAFIED